MFGTLTKAKTTHVDVDFDRLGTHSLVRRSKSRCLTSCFAFRIEFWYTDERIACCMVCSVFEHPGPLAYHPVECGDHQ